MSGNITFLHVFPGSKRTDAFVDIDRLMELGGYGNYNTCLFQHHEYIQKHAFSKASSGKELSIILNILIQVSMIESVVVL